MVLLIGNYLPDQQQSMLRFNAMMLNGLRDIGQDVQIIRPPAFFGTIGALGSTIGKWLAYIDKFILFRVRLWRALARKPAVVHICDHSNAMFSRSCRGFPVVVTCHDLLAVRGGLGEPTDCPASRSGKVLQRWIVSGLECAKAIRCISDATTDDARRLLKVREGIPDIATIEVGLNYPYQKLPDAIVGERLSRINGVNAGERYVIHVGSNLRRKNREGVLRIFAKCAEELNAKMVFVGEALNESLRALAQELGITERIVQIPGADDEALEALYNGSYALLFPSRFEGFGWPIIEAQACGCPVLCSSSGPMGQVAGLGALLRLPEDEAGFVADLLKLKDPSEHAQLSQRALENSKRYSSAEMIAKYRALYHSLAPSC